MKLKDYIKYFKTHKFCWNVIKNARYLVIEEGNFYFDLSKVKSIAKIKMLLNKKR